MNKENNDDWSYLDDLDSLTEGNAPEPEKKKANFQTEKLEERVLFSATWIDADTGEEMSNSTGDDDLFTGSSSGDHASGGA